MGFNSVAFNPGQVLGKEDLKIILTNSDGQRQNAYGITYAIFDNTSGTELLIGSATRAPENPEIGEYYANLRIPEFAPYGNYVVRWSFTQYAGGPTHQVAQEFGVVPVGTETATVSKYSEKEWSLIQSLRKMLRDNSPDRNYHFRPPSSQDAMSKQTRVFGYIWEDDELLEAVERGLDMVNLHPPQTNFTIKNLPRNWTTIVLTAAAIHAITALSLNWIAEEFDYSIGGVSLNIDKSSKYQSMADTLQGRLDTMKESAHQTIKLAVGIQQPRYGIGVRSAFGPALGAGVVSPRNFVRS